MEKTWREGEENEMNRRWWIYRVGRGGCKGERVRETGKTAP